MNRSLRRRLLRARRRPLGNGYPRGTAVTAILTLPHQQTADEPIWTPGPEFTQVEPRCRWARPLGAGKILAVVRSYTHDWVRPALLSGVLSLEDAYSFGSCLRDKPHRMLWQAEENTFTEQPICDDHPLRAWDRWADNLRRHVQQTILAQTPDVQLNVIGHGEWTVRIDGRWQYAIDLNIQGSDWFWSDLDGATSFVSRLTRAYGPGLRPRVRPGTLLDLPGDIRDPWWAESYRRLRTANVTTPLPHPASQGAP